MKPSLKRRQFFLFIMDLAVLYGALYLALILRHWRLPSPESWADHFYHFSFIQVAWLLIFYLFRLYALDLPFTSVRFAGRLSGAMGLAGLSSALYFYILPSAPITPKTVLLVYIAVAYFAVLAWRLAFMGLSKLSPARTRVAFIGAGPETWELVDALRSRPQLGYVTAFVYAEDEAEPKGAGRGVAVLRDPAALRETFRKSPVALAVLADHVAQSVEARRVLFDQVETGLRFERLQNFYEMYLRRVPLGVINEAWFLEHIDLRSKSWYAPFKRVLDLAFSLAALALTLPFWPFIALAIKLESPGPVFFTQERLGRRERPFTIYKFRTMRTDRNDFAPTGVGDPRITRFGNFMRKSRLDELPQLLNILRGEMSLVGPRPERPELAEGLEKVIPFYRQRHMVKPGVTGWDQVSGEYHSPSVEDTYKKLQYDLYYVKNLSVFLDFSIVFKTVMTVFARAGR